MKKDSKRGNIHILVYAKPKIWQGSEAPGTSDCIAYGKTWATSTDINYSEQEQAVIEYLEKLADRNITFEILDMNKASIRMKARLQGTKDPSLIVFNKGKKRILQLTENAVMGLKKVIEG
jgi:hypothetical protein